MDFVILESPGHWDPPIIRFVKAESEDAIRNWLSQEDGGDDVHTIFSKDQWAKKVKEVVTIPSLAATGPKHDKLTDPPRSQLSKITDPRITLLSSVGPRHDNQYFYSPSYVMENEQLGADGDERHPYYNPILGEALHYIHFTPANPVLAEALELFSTAFSDGIDDEFSEIPCLFRPDPMKELYGVHMLEEQEGNPSYVNHCLLPPSSPEVLLEFLKVKQTTFSI